MYFYYGNPLPTRRGAATPPNTNGETVDGIPMMLVCFVNLLGVISFFEPEPASNSVWSGDPTQSKGVDD